ncbi:MAG: glycosyltransferase family 2 protein [Muribaculaceae bacterium]|nr:glycosyltransferase family 2 protein [Muribaculaceae bacterium]
MIANSIDVSVIIVNYNTCDLTRKCIESIFKYTNGLSYEIILVDNASTDQSKSIFEKDNKIRYFYSNINLGFGKANNIGVEYSSGKYLFFLNSDAFLTSNAILQFFNDCERNPQIGALGGQLIWPDGSNQTSYFDFPSLKNIFLECLGLYRPKQSESQNNSNIILLSNQFVSGADLFMPKKIFLKLGGFYPGFFLYYEETDLQYHVFNSNSQIAFDSRIKIVHYNGGSQNTTKKFPLAKRREIFAKKLRIFNDSRIIYFRRNVSGSLFILRCILSFGVLIRINRVLGYFKELVKNVWKH